MNHQLLQQEIFSDIYQHKNKQHLIKANMLLDKYGAHIVDSFYSKLSSFEEANDFLTTDLVETRLKHSLKNWLLSISDFSLNHDYSIYLEKQQMIGKVHARIQIPMYLVNYGIDNLKQLIFETLLKEKIDANEKVIMINLINRIIDLAVMLFNNIYFDNSIKQKKNEQSLRQHYGVFQGSCRLIF